MTFNEIMNSPLLYGLVGLGIVYIILFCLVTLKKAYTHALELGITKEKLKLVITSSAIYSVVPSISIVIGLFSLASVLGVPWSWFRLSVVGSVTYELMAADMVATGTGYESVAALNAAGDASVVGTVMFVMSICIMGGLIAILLFGKKIQMGLTKARNKHGELGGPDHGRSLPGHHRGLPSHAVNEGQGTPGRCIYILYHRSDPSADYQAVQMPVAQKLCYGKHSASGHGILAGLDQDPWLILGGTQYG